MTPREFLDAVVRPNVAAFRVDFADLRHAYNAVAAVDALAAHMYGWLKANAPDAVAGIKDDSGYRDALAKRDADFALLRDVAKAQKHVHLTRGAPAVTRADQVASQPVGWGRGGFGKGRWGGPKQVLVTTAAGRLCFVESIVGRSLAFLEAEMAAIGM